MSGAVWDPGSVVLGPMGEMLVADSGNDRVRLLSPTGDLVATIGEPGSGPKQLLDPECAVFGPDGHVYVADSGNGRIQVFAQDGTWVRSIGSLGSLAAPKGVAVDGSGCVYVTESLAGRVRKFDAAGNQLLQWGGIGPYFGQFSNAWGIVVTGGYVYVADSGSNMRIQVFDSTTGAYVGRFGPYQQGTLNPSRFKVPVGITLAPNGDLVVTDQGIPAVARIPQWPAAAAWTGAMIAGGVTGEGPGAFQSPRGAAVAADGTLVVADSGNHRLCVRTPSSVWLAPLEAKGSGASRLWDPEAVAVDSIGRAYVADTRNQRVAILGREGEWVGSFGTSGTAPGQFSYPSGIVVAPDGDIFVGDTGNDRIQRFNANGEFETEIGADELDEPRGLALGQDGTLYVADTGNSRVAVFGPGGGLTASFGASGTAPGEFSSPQDVAVDDRGGLWVADTGNNRIQKLQSLTGDYLTQAGGWGEAPGQFWSPTSIAAVPGGGAVVTDLSNERIQAFDQDAHLVTYTGSRGAALGRFHRPSGVECSQDGRTYVVERDGARVQVFVRDAEPPVTTIIGVPTTVTALPYVNLSLEATDTSGIGSVWYRLNGGSPVRATTIKVSDEGTNTIAYWAVDRAGNVEATRSATVVLDRTPPQGTMLAQGGGFWLGSPDVTITSNMTDVVDMRVGVDYAMGEWGPYTETTQVVLPDVDGRYTVVAQYRDALGNTGTLTQAVGMDREAPGAPLAHSTTHPVSVVVRGGIIPRFEWTAPVDVSGIAGYSFVVDRSPDTTPDAVIDTGVRSASCAGLDGGEWYFHVRAVDVLGQWGPASHVKFALSSTPVVGAPRVARSALTTGSATFRYSGTVSPASPLSRVRVSAMRWENGRWVAKQTVSAEVVLDGTGSARYRGEMTLGAGKWRLRAMHVRCTYLENAYSSYGRILGVQ